jgi:tudor domain-containing protein 1/4/6/7
MFQELVVEREFVSIVMETGPDLLNPTNMILGLRLIDTSKSEDVYIDELLVSQGRAVEIALS